MSNTTQVDPAKAAELFIIHDQVHEPMHDRFLWATMQRRDAEAADIPEWEELREIASTIKEHTLTHLDHYLEEFEANATKRGAHVHWALDAAEHNQIVHSILKDHGVKEMIKSKSMLQEECQMTPCKTAASGSSNRIWVNESNSSTVNHLVTLCSQPSTKRGKTWQNYLRAPLVPIQTTMTPTF
jgi:hypothetical protein